MKKLFPILFISLFIFSCDNSPTGPEVIHGCMDSQSCNYDPNSTHDNNSCLELDECGECGGDNSTCTDDCGVVNGDNSTCTDECGILNGPGLDCNGDCNENVELWGECYNIQTTVTLDLGYNEFSGEIQLTGEIPSEIGILTNLDTLYLTKSNKMCF